MKTYTVPRTSLVVSRLAYGIGMLSENWRGADFMNKSVRAIHTAYEHGITFFDVADVYAEGRSEQALGQVLKGSRSARDRMVVQTKCGIRVRDGWDPSEPVGPDTLGVDLSRTHIVAAAERSLQRLGTDHLDILLLHSATPLVEPESVAEAFEDLHRSGKVLHFGVCTHSAIQIELLKKYVRQPLVVNQIWLGLARSTALSENSNYGPLVDYCRLHDIQVQAFSPLKADSLFARPTLLQPDENARPEMRQLAQKLADIARQYQVTSAAIMLAWLLRHPAGIVPIIGSSTPEHIGESCAADGVQLSGGEWHTLLAASERALS